MIPNLKQVDNRTYLAFLVIIFITFLSNPLWKYLNDNISWIQHIFEYRKLITVFIIIIPVVLFFDKTPITSIGFSIGGWKKILKATLIGSGVVLLVIFLIALFWKQLNQLRVEGEQIYFIGQQIPMGMVSLKLLYIIFLSHFC